MDLSIKDQLFIVGGAGSGFGKAITEALAGEGAKIIAIARSIERLNELSEQFPGQVEVAALDLSQPCSIDQIVQIVNGRQLHGILVNAGGPAAISTLETTLENWDDAYKLLLRWKVEMLQKLLPQMISNKYGRIVFVESVSVKQPIPNLVLSNSLRLAVVGFAKTLSQEISGTGITINILAPGYHKTAALNRIVDKKNRDTGVSRDDALKEFASQTTVGFIGDPADFASLAIWLLSPGSRYINGQTISVDGGSVKGTMG